MKISMKRGSIIGSIFQLISHLNKILGKGKKHMKVVFLDVDGVINSLQFCEKN